MPEGIVTYSYDDSTGALVRAELGEESLAFSWDGPLATGVSVAGTVAGDVSVTYDEALRITQESVSGSDVSFRYDYGRLIQAGEENIGYADAQRIQSRSHGTVTESLSYSSDYGELVDHDVSVNNTTLYQVSFERDALGRITQRSETVQGEPLSVTYGYDVLGRLVSTNDGTTQHTYQYDPNGNRLDDGAGFDSRDRLIRRGGATYAYTADGYLASRTDGGVTTKYVYDRIGQLRSLSKPGQTIEYVIDPLGRRIAKKVGGTLKQGFLYDLRGRVIAELDGDGALVSRFVYGAKPHVPGYLIQGNTTLHHHRRARQPPPRHRRRQRQRSAAHGLRRLGQRAARYPSRPAALRLCGRPVGCGHWSRAVRSAGLRSVHRAVDGEGSDSVRGRTGESLCVRRQ